MVESVATGQRITIITPARRGSPSGNRVTALRWAGLLRQLGHTVKIATEWHGTEAHNHACDVLLTVHAVKSAEAVLAASKDRPELRIATLLAGTDIYPEFSPDERVRRALDRADALIALQPRALDLLPANLLEKSRTIVQSATHIPTPKRDVFTACVIAHLRPVKQPHVAIEALGLRGEGFDIRLVVAGSRLDDGYGKQIAELVAREPACEWLGPLSRRDTKRLIASSHVCLVPSSSEGGANVVSEAIAAGTPCLCTAIPGNLGLLGENWPAVFPVGDAPALADLLRRCAKEKPFLDDLCRRTVDLQSMVDPRTEQRAWQALLVELRGD